MAAHSKIGASSMKRWANCPGSVKLSENIPSRSSEFAEEGTRAHGVAEQILLDRRIECDREMLDHVLVYTDYVQSLANPKDTGQELLVEKRFHLHQLHSDLFGTADAIVWQPTTETLHVVDLKYGAGVAVEVEDNPQLLYYALGALLETKYPARTVVMTIVQPRKPHPNGPIRSKTIDVVDLIDWTQDLLDAVERVEEAIDSYDDCHAAPTKGQHWRNDFLKPGDHCHWCPAAGLPCPALHAKAQEVAKGEFAPAFSYDATKLADTLKWLPVLESWIKNVREFAYAEAEHGRCAPGWKLVEKRATRKWREDESVVVNRIIEAASVSRDELYAPAKLLTVAQVEKLLPKADCSILEELTTKESSGFTLAPEDDPRKPAKASAADDFANT